MAEWFKAPVLKFEQGQAFASVLIRFSPYMLGFSAIRRAFHPSQSERFPASWVAKW